MISIFQIIVALALLFVGYRFFWFAVAALGFLAASQWAVTALSSQPEWVMILIALAVGVIGALLAVYLRVLGIGLAGFVGGALLTSALLVLLNVPQETLFTVLTIIGGVIGVILVFVVFDWAIILLTSISGATILASALTIDGVPMIVIAAVLAVVGVLVQARQLEPATT